MNVCCVVWMGSFEDITRIATKHKAYLTVITFDTGGVTKRGDGKFLVNEVTLSFEDPVDMCEFLKCWQEDGYTP